MNTITNHRKNPGFVSPSTAHTASKAAKERVGGSFIQEKRKVSVHARDLRHVRRLGKGGNCVVNEMQLGNDTFAVKKLRRTLVKSRNPDDCIRGVADLAGEVAIMTKLDHENIVKIRGMSSGSISNNLTSKDGMFVVMELLEKTLHDQIKEWGEDHQKKKMTRMIMGRNRKTMLLERLPSALQIAKALQYLHQQDIVHRDLKPSNIGLDKDGMVKLFDFGLAVEHNAENDGPLTEYCGTTHYMAPEVVRRDGYGREADVYAFGLILWEICEMDLVFKGYGSYQVCSKVVGKGERPQIQRWWPSELKDLLTQCWDASPLKRPTMDQVIVVLERISAPPPTRTTCSNKKKSNQ